MTEPRRFRTRYPARAVLLVAATALLCLTELAMMVLLLMPLIPLIPLMIAALVGQGCLLASAVDYARSHAEIVPVEGAGAETPKKAPEAPRGTFQHA